MRLYLYDDATADGWAPFALTRPVGELRYGVPLLRERLERWAGLRAAGHLARPWLRRYREAGAPPWVSSDAPGDGEARLFLSSRFVPTGPPPARLRARGAAGEAGRAGGSAGGGPGAPVLLRAGGLVVGALLPAGAATPGPGWFRSPGEAGGPEGADPLELEGEVLERPWHLVHGNPERLARDIARAAAAGADTPSPGGAGGRAAGGAPAPADRLPAGVERLGEGPVLLGDRVRLEPGTLLDTREGGVWLDEGVEVRTGCRLEGPLYAGPGSRLLGGPLSALSAGPYSYLRGEVEETVVLGYANKAHSGFLGHACLGRWVNLGASTTNSDLKNNYGPVRVGPPGREEDTGLVKLGCLLGDHVKTGIGTLLDTGTVVGAGSNLFGGAMPPKWVPPFSWGAGRELTEYRREAFLQTAATVMARRGVEVDEQARGWLAAVWDEGRRAAGD